MAERNQKFRLKAKKGAKSLSLKKSRGSEASTPKIKVKKKEVVKGEGLLLTRMGVKSKTSEIRKVKAEIEKIKTLPKSVQVKLLRSKIDYLENLIMSLDFHQIKDTNLDARRKVIVYSSKEARLKNAVEKLKDYEMKIKSIRDKIKKYQDFLVTKSGSIKLNLAVKGEILERLEKKLDLLGTTYKKKKNSSKKRGFFDGFFNKFRGKSQARSRDDHRRSRSVMKPPSSKKKHSFF